MKLNDLNLILGIVVAITTLYAGYYKKALKEAQEKGKDNAVIITMLEHHESLLTKLDDKLEKSAHDRHAIEKKIAGHDEQLITLFKDVKEIKANCKDCRKKCD